MINNNNGKGNVGNNWDIICEFKKLKQHYESLVESITKELEYYKTEHIILRAEIHAVILHNNESVRSKECTEDFTKYKNITENVIQNLRQQIEQLVQEKSSLHTLWNASQKIISNLEIEIREKDKIIKQPKIIDELKKRIEISHKNFETRNKNMKSELEKEKQINLCLLKNYKNTEEKLKLLEQKYNDLLVERPKFTKHITLIEQQLHSVKSTNAELQIAKKDLEKRLTESLCTVRESVQRETDALAKVQELLNITDLAIADKNATLLREKDIREDCDHLASNIAEVFEEAANKVEIDRKETEKRYSDNVKQLEGKIAKMKVTQAQLSQNYSILHQNIQVLESQLKESQETNSKLDSELQVASLQIVDLELKLRAAEKVIKNEKEANKIFEKRSQEFQDFLDSKKRLNERWKNTIMELNEKFQNEMKRLHEQIVHLQSSNQKLKAQLLNSVITSSNE